MKRIIAIFFTVGLLGLQVELFSQPGLYTRSASGRYHYFVIHNDTGRAQARKARFRANKRNKQQSSGLTCKQVVTVLVFGALITGGLMQWYNKQVLAE